MKAISRDTFKNTSITYGCLTLLVSMIVAYLYFLNMSVVQVVMRTEHTQHQQDLRADIASLEADYIKAQHKISTRIANLQGYNSDSPKIFVSAGQTKLGLVGQY